MEPIQCPASKRSLPESATGKAKELLQAVNGKLGMVPKMTQAMASSPAVLEGYLQFSGSLGHGSLSAQVREKLALAISQANRCDYCVAAHSAIGKMVGLSADQIRDSRLGTAVDPKTDSSDPVRPQGAGCARPCHRQRPDAVARPDSTTVSSPKSWRTSRWTSSPTTSTTSPRPTSTFPGPRALEAGGGSNGL